MAERRARTWAFAQHQAAAHAQTGESVAVLGLGRFGGAVASELVRLGFDVLGVDDAESVVQTYTSRVTHVVEADITNVDALRQLGIDDIKHAIVAVGSDLEASILATAALDELGVPAIWAKAVSPQHGRILQRVGAHHVVYPEHDMGHQVAHMIGGRILDWFQLDERFALVETVAPAEVAGRSLADVGVREKYRDHRRVREAGRWHLHVRDWDTVLAKGDLLVIAGETPAAEAFARLG